jgi:hypothetical protein
VHAAQAPAGKASQVTSLIKNIASVIHSSRLLQPRRESGRVRFSLASSNFRILNSLHFSLNCNFHLMQLLSQWQALLHTPDAVEYDPGEHVVTARLPMLTWTGEALNMMWIHVSLRLKMTRHMERETCGQIAI